MGASGEEVEHDPASQAISWEGSGRHGARQSHCRLTLWGERRILVGLCSGSEMPRVLTREALIAVPSPESFFANEGVQNVIFTILFMSLLLSILPFLLPPTYLPSFCPGPGQPATITCQAVAYPAHQLPWGTRES